MIHSYPRAAPEADEHLRPLETPAPDGSRRPLMLSLIALLSVVLAAVSFTGFAGSGVLLGAAVLAGPGSAWLWTQRRLANSVVAALVPATGIALVAIAGSAMLATHTWSPRLGSVLLFALVLVGGALGLSTAADEGALPDDWTAPAHSLVDRGIDSVRRATGAYACLAAGLLCWLLLVTVQRPGQVGDYGLVASAPLLAVAGLLIAGGFVVATVQNSLPAMALAIAGEIVVFRVTGLVLTDVPSSFYTYTHLGVTDLFATTGALHPGVDIYQAWPAMFAAMAWLGAFDPTVQVTFAHLFPSVTHLLTAVCLIAVARGLGASRRAAAVTAFLAEVTNWVGQDYYSPQAVGFVLALAMLGVLLRGRGAIVWTAVPLYLALVLSHQLTPVWALAVVYGLTVLGRIKPWTILVPLTVVLGVNMVMNLEAIAPYGLLSGFSLDNTESNIATPGVPARELSQLLTRVLAVVLWGGVAVELTRRLLLRDRIKPLLIRAVLALSSFSILAGQSYGGEAIFRVFLYSAPGCALILAELVDELLTRRRRAHRVPSAAGRVARRAAVALLLLAPTVLGLQLSFAAWNLGLVRKSDVAAVERLYAITDPPARLLFAGPGLPVKPNARYAAFAAADEHYDRPLIGSPEFDGVPMATPDDLAQLGEVIGPQRGPTYLVFAPAMRNYARYYGLMAPDDYNRFAELTAESPAWLRMPGFPADVAVYRWVGENP